MTSSRNKRTSAEDKLALNPGDQATPGTPGTGEDICPDCHGSGRRTGTRCETCGGSGRVIKGIGGG